MESRLRHVAVKLVDLVFPRCCVRCGGEGSVLCSRCEAAGPMRAAQVCCPFCGEGDAARTCFACREEHAIEGVTALATYADPVVRRVITGWKYHGDPAYTQVIESWIGASNVLARFQCWTIIPVPLHAARRRSRGFDQAVEIARMVAKASGGVFAEPLIRQWYTSPRAQTKRTDRDDTELYGAFQAKGPVPQNILLCDDVFTTGATLEAAATALKHAGAAHIWAFTVARS